MIISEGEIMNAEYTGKKIAELRKEKNMTQKELADKLYVTDKAVSKWERGVNFPDFGLMEKVAEALDTTPTILLGLENSTKEEKNKAAKRVESLLTDEEFKYYKSQMKKSGRRRQKFHFKKIILHKLLDEHQNSISGFINM